MKFEKKVMIYGGVLLALFLIVVIVAIIIGRQEANKRYEETKVMLNENGEEVVNLTVDKNVETKISDITSEEGNYKIFRYSIENKTTSPIKYKMDSDVFVDYMLYEKNKKGEFERIYHYSVDAGEAKGVMYLDVPVGEVVNRDYRLNRISPGEYKIEFWLNVDETRKVNLETMQFIIK